MAKRKAQPHHRPDYAAIIARNASSSPFAGIGSEGYVALQEGRRFIGAELKASYYKQAVANLKAAANPAQQSLFEAGA